MEWPRGVRGGTATLAVEDGLGRGPMSDGTRVGDGHADHLPRRIEGKQRGVAEECGRYAPLSEQSTPYSRLNLPVSLVAAHMSLVRSNGIRVNKALCPGRSRPRGWLPTAWVPERRTGPRERLGLGCLFHVLNEFSFVQ